MFTCAVILSFSAPTYATDTRFEGVFVESSVGFARGRFDDLDFVNPNGVTRTTNPTSGNSIILDNKDLEDGGFSGSVAIGMKPLENVIAKLSFNYFGDFDAKGDATFGGRPFDQDLNVEAMGLMLGVGYQFDLTDRVFLEPNVEIGVARLDVEGKQGRNQNRNNTFPSKEYTNFAYGVGLNAGYALNDRVASIFSFSYHDLGKTNTGKTGNPPPAGMNAGEQLRSDLETFSVRIGLRYSF
jgi:opacity protein-like surface antigen